MKHLCFIFSCLVAFAGISSPAQVNLGSVNAGSSSSKSVTVTLPATGRWAFFVTTGGNPNADFTDAGSGTCNSTTTYAAGSECTVDVKFTPKAGGPRYGAITLGPLSLTTPLTSSNSPQAIYLKGIGTAAQISFSPGADFKIATIQNPQGIAVDRSGDVYVDGGAIPAPGSSGYGYQVVLAPTGIGTYEIKTQDQQLGGEGAWNDQAGNFYFHSICCGVIKDGAPILYGVSPTSLAGDATENLFVIGSGQNISSNGVYLYKLVRTLYGSNLPQTSYVEAGSIGSGFVAPSKVWADGLGNAYVLDSGTLYKESLQSGGGYQQSTITAGSSPFETIFVDPIGNLYGYAGGSGQLTKETLREDGSFVGSNLTAFAASAAFLTFDSAGNQYSSLLSEPDNYHGEVYLESSAVPAGVSFASTARGSQTTDSSSAITITNSGYDPLQFSTITYPVDFPEDTSAGGLCTTSTSLATGSSCKILAKFAPTTPLPNGATYAVLSESVSITTNTGSNPGTQQSIAVSGTETPGNLPAKIATTTTLTGNPSSNLTVGEKIVLTIVVKPVSGTVAPTGTVTLASTTSTATLTVNLDSTGKAIVNTVAPAKGYMTLFATYNGSATDASSVSTTLSTQVN